MVRVQKWICLMLVLCMLPGICPVPARANDEDPQALKKLEEFGAAMPLEEAKKEMPPEETVVEPEVPDETVEEAEPLPEEEPEKTAEEEPATEETVAEETQPEETAPGKTVPEETVTEETEPEEVEETIDTVPLYFQTDYPDIRYGAGTIASSGCSVTCLAMVATYLTDHEYLPDELARYFGGRAENNIARMETGSDVLQLAWEKSENWHKTMEALHEGKIVVALMEETSLFTEGQHFILLTGLTEDGKIMVHDPNAWNYEVWNLKNGFEKGFDEASILLGYSGGWIYDKEAMPEDPYIHFEPMPERQEPRYGIELTAEETELLARVVWVESRGECAEGQQAVAEVVLNRMASENFPDSLNDVIYGEGQFRSVPWLEEAEPYQVQYEAIEKALYGPYVLPEDVMYFATFQTNEDVWGQIGGHIFCYG